MKEAGEQTEKVNIEMLHIPPWAMRSFARSGSKEKDANKKISDMLSHTKEKTKENQEANQD